MDIQAIRNQIPATRQGIYLNTGWDGPSPIPVLEAIRSQLELEAHHGPTVPELQQRRRAIFAEAKAAVASVLNVGAHEIALTENTTAGINLVLNGLDWNPGDEIVTCTMEHGSGLVPAYLLSRRAELQTRVVPLDPGDSNEAIIRKLGEAFSSRTRLLLLSHITYTTGLVMPLKELSGLAHEHGATVLVDAAQSMGQLPLDLRDIDCDFYALPGHKWLLGPDGTGALYIRASLIPQVQTTWVSSRAVASYDREGHYELNPESMEKFELTTHSPAMYSGLTAAVHFLQDAGMEQIRARQLALTAWLKQRLQAIPGVAIYSPREPERSCGLVTFGVEGVEPRDMQQALWERHQIMGRTIPTPPSVRLSINFFTTEEELDQVVRAVQTLASSA